jgi:anhydro-N-acetylmuramic acid kinase
MVYRSLGVLVCQSGFTLVFAEFQENAGVWTFELKTAVSYPAGTGTELIHSFIEKNELQYKVALITLHIETPGTIISGASVAAATGLPVITQLADLDLELGGNGEFYSSCSQKLHLPNNSLGETEKATCVAFMGILRWREEYNFLSSITGARRSSIGGAVWTGQEA